MKLYVLVAFLVSTCLARPDVSHLVKEPSNEYLPSLTGKDKTLLLDTRSNTIAGQESGIVSVTPAATVSTTSSGIGASGLSLVRNQQESSTARVPISSQATLITENKFNPSVSVISAGSIPTGSYLPTSGFISIGAQGSGGDGSFLGLPGSFGIQQQQAESSVYFFAAPEEQSQSRLRINIIPTTQSKTRVIFIKAPTYSAPIPEVISAPSQTEDKTLIYVLSKKPDPVLPISIPTSTVVKPKKPEIYFIKYGSKDDAEEVVASGLKGQIVGANLDDLKNVQTFINTIQDSQAGGSHVSGGITIIPGSVGHTTGGSISTTINDFSISSTTEGNKYGPAGESGPY